MSSDNSISDNFNRGKGHWGLLLVNLHFEIPFTKYSTIIIFIWDASVSVLFMEIFNWKVTFRTHQCKSFLAFGLLMHKPQQILPRCFLPCSSVGNHEEQTKPPTHHFPTNWVTHRPKVLDSQRNAEAKVAAASEVSLV